MKGKLAVTGLLPLALLSGGGSALAQDAADDELATPTGTMQQRANDVALVLASDPRFEGLIDFETLRREVAADFEGERYFTSSFYRVLGPTFSELTGFVSLREPVGRLIEVNLVTDCAEFELDGEALPTEDWCAWRHTWVYLVEPDGTVAPVYDAGDPDPSS